jgi:hypothetical protein
MAYTAGVVSVLSASATPICRPGPGGCFVQNLGANAVTLGGPGVTAAGGIVLPAAMSLPLFIASGILPLSQDADDQLYGRAATATSNVAFLAAG